MKNKFLKIMQVLYFDVNVDDTVNVLKVAKKM